MNKAYITPTGSGRGDGSSWEHAAKLGQINKLIEKVGPGGEVLLRADLGTYRISGPLEITKGGTAAGDVTIRGVDVNGADMLAHFKGTRMDVYTPGGAPGLDGLRLLTGANHLDIKNVKLEDFGRAIHVGSAIKDLEISNVVGENVQRFFDNDYRTGPNRDASITGLLIENVEVRGFSKGVIRLTDSTNDVVIRNVYGDSERQDKDNFAQGVHLTENVHNVLIENTTMRNSHSSLGAYWNGDGFVTEKGVSNVRFINTVATGSTDAGYDLKSTDTVLIGAYAADNKRNYRIWSDEVTIIDSISVDAFNRQTGGGGAHVWVSDNRVANLVNFSVYENNPRSIVFQADGRGSRVLLDGVDIYTVPAVRVIGTVNPAGFLTEVDGRPIVAQALLPGMMPPETGHVGSIKPMIEPPKPSVLSISASQASMGEGQFGQTETSFTITRTGPSDKEASVSWAVAGSGPAAADAKDFTGDALPAGTVQFAAGETTKTVVVTVKADRLVEADESFTVTLSAPINAQIGESSVRMTILNDDPLATGITTIAAANAVDLSARGHQVVSGPAHHNIFFVNSEAATGRDTILNFGKDDVLVTTRALHDGNRDGLITYSRNTL
nr:hypothetical protein [Hyphomonas sp.]